RAEELIVDRVVGLVDPVDGVEADGEGAYGRAAHQAPETDGQVVFTDSTGLVPGRIVTAKVVGTLGVDLVAEPLGMDLEEAAG
ncbi:30S ribosomal protein S12 methylthiotransferase RimO, partial [Streptomyces sp. NPDC059558]